MWRRKAVAILIFIIPIVLPLLLKSQEKPFIQEQVSNMVRAGLGDDSGAKLIEQRGIDFAPKEDYIQTLRAADASETFLTVQRKANRLVINSFHSHLSTEGL